MAMLRLTSQLGEEGRYPLADDQYVIGRQKSCDITIGADGREVSKQHAMFMRRGDDWYVNDLQSRNHTFVNGFKLEGDHKLADGDRVTVCRYDLIFHDSDSGSVHVTDDTETKAFDASSSLSLSATSESLKTRAKLSVLMRIARSLQNTLSLDEVLSQTMDSLFEIFPAAQRGVIGFWCSDEFQPRWWKLRDTEPSGDIRVSKTIVREVVEKQEAILIENAIAQFPSLESVQGLPITSLMCAPMFDANSNVFGIFQIDAPAKQGFTSDDLELIAAVAIQASFAINYARLHEETLMQKAFAKDLELARDVQDEFLPNCQPNVPGYEFADYYEPARFIGGDYFDYVPLANGGVAIVIADVVGKGAPAALYMARLAMETRACIGQFERPADVINQLNRRLANRFTTIAICFLDPASHRVTVVNAGHRAPMLRKVDGTLELLGESISGFPFSVVDDADFEEATYPIAPGESVCMFSDGFEDVYDAVTESYLGIDRIKETLAQSSGSAGEMVDTVVRRSKEFAGDTVQFDDMCMTACRRTS